LGGKVKGRMSEAEFLGMLVIGSLSLVALIGGFAKLAWDLSQVLSELNTTLKSVVDISNKYGSRLDAHDESFGSMGILILKNSNEIRSINERCAYLHQTSKGSQ